MQPVRIGIWWFGNLGFITASVERFVAAIREPTAVPIALVFIVLLFAVCWYLLCPEEVA